MSTENSGIFVRPYRMPVINALRVAVTGVIERDLPTQVDSVIEVGCGSGFLYTNLLPENLKSGYQGTDNHQPSLALFNKIAPEALSFHSDARNMPFVNNSADVVIGFSAYPLFTKDEVIAEAVRILKPGARLAIFQDSGIGIPGIDRTAYDEMKRLETVHSELMRKLPTKGFSIVSGQEVLEAAVVTPYNQMKNRIPSADLSRMNADSFLIAFSSDLGVNRLHHSPPRQGLKKLRQTIQDLGSPKILETVKLKPRRQALEYVRLRYIVAEKSATA